MPGLELLWSRLLRFRPLQSRVLTQTDRLPLGSPALALPMRPQVAGKTRISRTSVRSRRETSARAHLRTLPRVLFGEPLETPRFRLRIPVRHCHSLCVPYFKDTQ